MKTCSFTVPLVPPSVNTYVRHSGGKHFKTGVAKAFMDAIAIFSRGAALEREQRYRVDIQIYLGSNQKGDIDNFAKCVLDGMVDAGVIDTDAAVDCLFMVKSRDTINPRTEIHAWVIE